MQQQLGKVADSILTTSHHPITVEEVKPGENQDGDFINIRLRTRGPCQGSFPGKVERSNDVPNDELTTDISPTVRA